MSSILKSGAMAVILGSCLVTPTQAHHPWVLTNPGHTEAGTRASVRPYFGHKFPADEAMHPDRIAQLILLGADGERIEIDRDALATPILTEGVHVIGLRQVRGYWSQTPDGGRPLPRAELDNAVSCAYSDNGAKTMVIVGTGGPSAAGMALGHRLEILTDSDPAGRAAGELLTIQVLFDGEPHAGPLLAFHAGSGEDPFEATETAADGRAEIHLQGESPWLLLAHAEIDYADPTVCDVERFYATLSFGTPAPR